MDEPGTITFECCAHTGFRWFRRPTLLVHRLIALMLQDGFTMPIELCAVSHGTPSQIQGHLPLHPQATAHVLSPGVDCLPQRNRIAVEACTWNSAPTGRITTAYFAGYRPIGALVPIVHQPPVQIRVTNCVMTAAITQLVTGRPSGRRLWLLHHRCLARLRVSTNPVPPATASTASARMPVTAAPVFESGPPLAEPPFTVATGAPE